MFAPIAEQIHKVSLSAEKTGTITGLNCLYGIEHLSVSGNASTVDFGKFQRLKTFYVNEDFRGGKWWECESVEFLMLSVAVPNLKKFHRMKKLNSLSIGKGLKSFEGIEDLPALRELRIGGSHLPSIESLGQLPNLRLLMLNLMPKLKSLKGLEGLTGLEVLDVTQCGGLEDVSAISELKNLKNLELGCCPHIHSLDGIAIPDDCAVSFVPGGKVSDGF